MSASIPLSDHQNYYYSDYVFSGNPILLLDHHLPTPITSSDSSGGGSCSAGMYGGVEVNNVPLISTATNTCTMVSPFEYCPTTDNYIVSSSSAASLLGISSDHLTPAAALPDHYESSLKEYSSNFWPLPPPVYPTMTGQNWEVEGSGMAQRVEDNTTLRIACRYSAEERKDRILRYLKKRSQRNFNKTIKYACRKTLADRRVRVRGRFAKNEVSDDDPTLLITDLKTSDHNEDHRIINHLRHQEQSCYAHNLSFLQMKHPSEEEWLEEAIANLMCALPELQHEFK